MGFLLTAFYIIVTIISPDQFGPQWAHYHVVLYLAVVTLLFSVPEIGARRQLSASIQTFLMLGFILAIGASAAVNGWIGGAIESWKIFLPSAVVFFFIVANVTTIRRLKIITLVATAACVAVVVEALCGYYFGFRSDTFVLQQSIATPGEVAGQLARLRGVGFLNDPNDFAQILLIVLPLLTLAWRKGRSIENIALVYVPAVLLLWAVYLTHSRGALIALAILVLMTAQKKLGTVTSAVLIAVLIAGLMALDFTGGRGISAGDGAERLDAWANGLEMFKRAPLFGIGFGAFTDFNDITAHNSFVLCLTELGLVGATLWVSLLVTTMTSLNGMICQGQKAKITRVCSAMATGSRKGLTFLEPQQNLGGQPLGPDTPPISGAGGTNISGPKPQLSMPSHWLLAMRLSLVGFIATSWFLSRSYSTPMYLVLGLATAAVALARPSPKSDLRSHWLFFTLAAEATALICVYGMVHLRN